MDVDMNLILNYALVWLALLGTGDDSYTLTVLHTNDTHGRPLAFERDARRVGGIPARKSAVDQIKREEQNVLLLDAGDVCDGMPVSNLNGVEPDFIGMALLGYDAMTVGNHEFSHDLETILGFEELAGFPFLCANLVKEANQVHPFDPYIIIERGGRKIAIIGFITPDLESMVLADRLEQLEVLDPEAVVRDLVPRLRERVDHVIVLSHCGYGYDRNRLARSIAGIDLIVGGHSHTALFTPRRVRNTVVVQAGCHGLFLGKVTLHFEGRDLERFEGGLIPINLEPDEGTQENTQPLRLGPFDEDPEVLARLEPYLKRLSATLMRVVGAVTEPSPAEGEGWLDRPYPNLVADALRWAADADCAIQNTGGVRTRLGPGEVTVNDIVTMLPFDNTVMVVSLEGRTLLEALRHSIFIAEERQRAFGAVAGMEVVIAPPPERDLTVTIGGAPLRAESVYTVAINSYMYQRGDGYVMFGKNKGVKDLGFKYSEALIRFVESRKEVTPAAEGRIRVESRR